MKYGETLRRRSIPAWSGYNIDYDDIKHFIKERTTPGKGKTVVIPGRGDEAAQRFEDELLLALEEQHQRIDLFVKSKAREIQHRIDDARKRLRHLAARNPNADQRIPVSRLERYGRLEYGVVKAGEEIKSLARFTSTQRTAFRKLLKKYKKYTGSPQLEERFREQVLDDPKSFTQYDLKPLLDNYSETLHDVRALYETRMQTNHARKVENQKPGAISSNPNTSNLQEVLANGSRTDFDAAFATIPLGESGTLASYFVHPENVIELQVLLLQHMRYFYTRSRANSLASPASPSSRAGAPISTRPASNFFSLAADSSERFMKEQSALTVDEREHRTGVTSQRTKICARWQEDEDAAIAARTGGVGISVSSLKRKHLDAFFDKSTPFLSRRGSSQYLQNNREELEKIREMVKDEQTKTLYLMSSCRLRMVGINNTAKGVLAATLDTGISFKAPGSANEQSDFPFAILQIRQDGTAASDLIKVLDASHLAERVPGFSMEYHAIWQVCKPKSVSAPFWIPILSRDIRKLPPQTTKHTTSTSNAPGVSTGTGSPSATLGSNNSATGATEDSITAVDTTHPNPTFATTDTVTPPLRAFRKKRRNRAYPEQNQPSKPQDRYWSEYDHPEDGSEANDAYVLYFDPSEKSAFEAFFERVGRFFSRKNRNSETESLLTSPREDESSSDEEEAPTRPVNQRAANSGYGTLPAKRARSLKAASLHPPPPLLSHFATTCFIASLIILVVAYVLAATGKRKLVREVDSGIIFAVISSLVFGVVGFGSLLRNQDVRWVSWMIAGVFLVVDVTGSGGLLAWMLG